MKVLLTGATGFVGQNLLRRLILDGNEIRLLSRKSVENHQIIPCDFVLDEIPPEALDQIDTVFHLAGFAHDRRNPSKVEHLYKKVNVDATTRLAELAVASGVKRFVFVSSVKAGARALPGQCMAEEDPGEPDGIYGQTKREAETKLLNICNNSSTQVTIVRSALAYGPGVKGNLRTMLNGIQKGWFLPFPEVGNIRSMIHVDDLVEAMLFIANDDRTIGEIYNVTDGRKYSSREIYDAMHTVLGKHTPRWSVPKVAFNLLAIVNPRLKSNVKRLFGDECYSSEKLQLLGFEPKLSIENMNETTN